MKLTTGVHLLRVLNSRKENALTTKEIARRWRDLGGDEISLRSIQRYMSDLSQDTAGGKALVTATTVDAERAFYLNHSQVANWFMTEEAALDLQLTQQVLGRAFGSRERSNGDKLADMAERVTAASPKTRRIRESLRIVPDGIGRLPARIDAQVLQKAIDAVGKGKKLEFSYANSAGQPSAQLVSPLGLVAKDGTIYLVAIEGLGDTPRPFALHRMAKADVHFETAQPRPDFDLDDYILASHQFSHVLDASAPPAKLKLRVAPEALFHFLERPLSTDQPKKPPKGPDGWFLVTATVPDSVLLVPFLVSMGPWIEVLEPAGIRAKTAQWLRDSFALYATDAAAR
jgi:predicted DNA-binding transcriptional regulator YafY